MEASAPPGDGDWDVVNQAVSGSVMPLGPDGLLTVKVTWEAKNATSGESGGIASYFGTGSAPAVPDIDLSAICFALDGTALEAIFFNHTQSLSSRTPGAIELVSGDQSSGHIGEEMRLRLEDIPANCTNIALVVTSANSVPLSAVKGICMSATLAGQSSDSYSCDHLTWQEDDFPSSPNSPAAANPAAAGAGAKAPPLYGSQNQRNQNQPPAHSVSIPFTLSVAAATAKSARPWNLNVVNWSVPSAQSFVDALPEIRRAAKVPKSGSTNFKIPVVLHKGESILLQGAHTHAPLHVGCGWDEDKTAANNVGADSCDADLSVLLLGKGKGGGGSTELDILDTIYWGKLEGFDGAVIHSGDNQTGEGDGDDESVALNLSRLPTAVDSIMFLVSNYNEGGLKSLKNVHFRVVRQSDSAEVVRYDRIGDGSEISGAYSAFIPCSFRRQGAGGADWSVECHAAPIRDAKTVTDPEVREVISTLLAAGGSAIKPVNLRRSLMENTPPPQYKSGGKTAAPLPDIKPPTKGKNNKPVAVAGQQQQQEAGGVPLPVKVLLFLVVVLALKVVTAR